MERRLAAILAADVVGYSRLMGANEVGTLTAMREIRTGLIDEAIGDAGGRIVKLMGDGILAEFTSVVGALESALAIQHAMDTRNADVPEDRQIRFRIGINIGDVVVEDDDIFGDGVNIAARIEALARPGGIAVSGAVRDQVGKRLDVAFDSAGEPPLKNIDEPVPVFHVAPRPSEPHSTAGAPASLPSIAVLPFTNMSGDPEQEYFADGITEDLITDLSKLSGLFVVGRNSAFVYKGTPVNLQEIARNLGVRHILEGSVRKSGNRIRITGQLIDGVTGGHLWADRYDRDLSDIFALQDEITKTIIDQLQVRLLETDTPDRTKAENAGAYTHYLKGRQLYHMRTRRLMEQARTHFFKALEHDPNYARAYVGLADCESRLNDWYGCEYPPEDILALTHRALELEPGMAEAHAANGLALQLAGRDDEARQAYETALAHDPLCYEAHHYFARFLQVTQEFEKCAYHFLRALEIKPDDYRSPLLIVSVYHALGRTEEADRYMALGLKRAEEAAGADPKNSDPIELGASVLAAHGDKVKARDWLERAIAIDPDRSFTSGYNIACTYAQLGEAEIALDWLESIAGNLGQSQRKWMRTDPDFNSLHDHMRFKRLIDPSL
ncbi:TPR end-of-group domain-containing protein [Roseibium sp.]|uniref:TPR end-of-group domain-containing protein n=1 Tax=Roseibium sp. TaxID=1936156 RepID=UPI003D12E347